MSRTLVPSDVHLRVFFCERVFWATRRFRAFFIRDPFRVTGDRRVSFSFWHACREHWFLATYISVSLMSTLALTWGIWILYTSPLGHLRAFLETLARVSYLFWFMLVGLSRGTPVMVCSLLSAHSSLYRLVFLGMIYYSTFSVFYYDFLLWPFPAPSVWLQASPSWSQPMRPVRQQLICKLWLFF